MMTLLYGWAAVVVALLAWAGWEAVHDADTRALADELAARSRVTAPAPTGGQLQFRRLLDGYWVADPADPTASRLGAPVWTVRSTDALLKRYPARPYRVENPEGYIVAEGMTLDAAIHFAQRLEALRETLFDLD